MRVVRLSDVDHRQHDEDERLQERAEDREQHNQGGGHVDRDTENAFQRDETRGHSIGSQSGFVARKVTYYSTIKDFKLDKATRNSLLG